MNLETRLAEGLRTLGLSDTERLVEASLHFQALLLKWNKVTNLTAITSPEQVITHHLLDAFAVDPYITGHTILDVGSGGGIPGIPLALANPDKDFILLDPNGKKTRFMTQAKIELELTNVVVIQARVEDHTGQYDQVISRAFRQVAGFVDSCARLVRSGGSLLAMKGPDYEDEVAQLAELRNRIQTIDLAVPGLNASRYLIRISC
jgi:16S rRNA (guanine527-N7)-methyltransferase